MASDNDNEIELDATVRRQLDLLSKMKKAVRNFRKDGADRQTKEHYEARLAKLDSQNRKFVANHELLLDMNLDPKDVYFTDEVAEEFDEEFINAVGVITAVCHTKFPMVQAPAAQANQVVQPAANVTASTAAVRLPKLTVPTYSGIYTDWPSFYDSFKRLIHENQSISAIEKFIYLKEALPTDFHRDIRDLPISEANYNETWKELVDRNNSTRVLFTHFMNLLSSQPTISKESANAMRTLVHTSRACVNALKNLGVDIDACDEVVVHFLIAKLPKQTHQLWEQELGKSSEIPKFKKFVDFLDVRYRTLEAIEFNESHKPATSSSSSVNSNNRPRRSDVVSHKVHHVEQEGKALKCTLCDNNHVLRRCQKFIELNAYDRKKHANKGRHCINCLSTNHRLATCPSTKNCQVCGKRHHTLLHFPESSNANQVSDDSSNTSYASNSNATQTHHVQGSIVPVLAKSLKFTNQYHVLLPTAMVNVVIADGRLHLLRALIDQGSTGTLVSERAAQALHLKRLPILSAIKMADGQRTSSHGVVSFKIQSCTDKQYEFEATAAVVKSVTDRLPSKTVEFHDWPHLRGIELADPHFYRSVQIDLLLGADIYANILKEGLLKGQPNEPIAQHTALGWIISGVCSQIATPAGPSKSISNNHVSLESLDTLVKKFYELESVPSEHQISKEDKWCKEYFTNTHVRQTNGKYMVRLPLKSLFDNSLGLGKSHQMALNRFYSTERKCKSNSKLKQQYDEAINSYFALNQIEPISTTENQHVKLNKYGQTAYLCSTLPHHAVIRDDHLTTKCRVVFDASAKTSNGNSLNDLLCVGPPLLNDLSTVLMNWRLHEYVITSDVQKMYRCIDMHEEDSYYQKILWYDKSNQVKEYRLTTVTFGTASATYTAVQIMHTLADDECERYPLASNVLKHEMYMDDVYTGSDSIESTIKIRDHTIGALQSAGFKLHKWASNAPELLASISGEQQEVNETLVLNDHETIKTLGMHWRPAADCFCYKINFEIDVERESWTKRSVLSTIAKLFDPLGLINPVIVSAKIFMKRLWSFNLDWDEQIPCELKREWIQMLTGLSALNELQISRWLHFSAATAKRVELHVFCDGSSHAYAALAYLRVQDSSDQFHVHLITAKSKVTPKPPITIPRIELCAAVLGLKLAQWVCQHIAITKSIAQVYYWLDATIVLSWIRGNINKWPVFVANRIGMIHAATNVSQWNHVSTHENPADHSSRGLTAQQIIGLEAYWHGPKWLNEPQDKWPKSDWTCLEVDQLEKTVHAADVSIRDSIIHNYSSLNQLLRITARLFRFFNNCRKPKRTREVGSITVLELGTALSALVKTVQLECFAADMHKVLKESVVSKTLIPLTPFIDAHGLLRVRGRLQRSNLPFNQKHPMILPKQHHFTNLLIDDAHQNTLHGGTQLVLNLIRKRFWIIHAKQVIQIRLRKCVRCFREKPQIAQQLMGNLPEPRITSCSRPFTATGIDFTGAIELKASRYRGNTVYKGYIAVFICLSTKAVHLEAVSGMSTDHFLCALYRFIGRRGLCHDIYSDCGTNFVGADRVLRSNSKKFAESVNSEVVPKLAQRNIQWHFNPPHSPNFGGLWEANVKSVKHHLKRVTTGLPMTFEDLTTVLAQIESCLNSRPLCPLTSETDDLAVLTPGHFLIGDALLAPPEPLIVDNSPNQHYLKLQRMQQQFWRKWSSDWLSHLQSRPKWNRPKQNFELNDIVIVKDDRLPPNQWQIGRIVDVHPGVDQLVRVVTVRTRAGSYKRCVSKLCRLPVDESHKL